MADGLPEKLNMGVSIIIISMLHASSLTMALGVANLCRHAPAGLVALFTFSIWIKFYNQLVEDSEVTDWRWTNCDDR
ncbi:hypothetical protein PanWU01x14_345640 [Parasponia andersonii]|uniref:Uncharacterized protein n=1 Tax=Parasponia andersonii TaxID=3476 RepID=A0A2P5ACJ5_PARAD|nr:hypothetical protein PanWU01x14_345640 [Parasponia andersonii]